MLCEVTGTRIRKWPKHARPVGRERLTGRQSSVDASFLSCSGARPAAIRVSRPDGRDVRVPASRALTVARLVQLTR